MGGKAASVTSRTKSSPRVCVLTGIGVVTLRTLQVHRKECSLSGEKQKHYDMTKIACRDCRYEWEVALPMTPDGHGLDCPRCGAVGVYTGKVRNSFCPDGRMMVSEEAEHSSGIRHVVEVDW